MVNNPDKKGIGGPRDPEKMAFIFFISLFNNNNLLLLQ